MRPDFSSIRKSIRFIFLAKRSRSRGPGRRGRPDESKASPRVRANGPGSSRPRRSRRSRVRWRVAGLGPDLAQRATHVATAEDADFHEGRLMEKKVGDRDHAIWWSRLGVGAKVGTTIRVTRRGAFGFERGSHLAQGCRAGADSVKRRGWRASWARLSKMTRIRSELVSAVARKKQNIISSRVPSPQVTRLGGVLGLKGLASELSKRASTSSTVPAGRRKGRSK